MCLGSKGSLASSYIQNLHGFLFISSWVSYKHANLPFHYHCPLFSYIRSQQALLVMISILNISDFLNHLFSVTTTQFCPLPHCTCSTHVHCTVCTVPQKQPQTGCIEGHNCVSTKFYSQKLAAGDLPGAHRPHSANPCFRAWLRNQKEAKRGSQHP